MQYVFRKKRHVGRKRRLHRSARRKCRRQPCFEPFEERTLLATANVDGIWPNPRAASVDEITISFSDEVTGFDTGALSLTRKTDTSIRLSLDSATLSSADNIHWTLANLSDLTYGGGIYELILDTNASGLRSSDGGPITGSPRQQWINRAGDAT